MEVKENRDITRVRVKIIHQNNPEDTHLKTVKCRAIHTYKLILKCVINKNCPVLQLQFVLTVKNTI